jgi:hypothetical protein
MKVKIKGVKNKTNKKVVEKTLEDAGFTACEVDPTMKTLTVPDIYYSELDEIALALAEVGEYEIDIMI